jgi:hypothetical protein
MPMSKMWRDGCLVADFEQFNFYNLENLAPREKCPSVHSSVVEVTRAYLRGIYRKSKCHRN